MVDPQAPPDAAQAMPPQAAVQPQPEKVPDYEPKTVKLSDKAAKELLLKARKAYRLDAEADQHNRTKAIEDLRFLHLPGHQWDETIKKRRGSRPCYEFNKTRVTVKRVVNDMRANRPSGKVRGTEDGDKKTADVYEGLIRNIWNVSDGDTAIDHAAEFQVGGGIGAWRVSTEWSTDEAWSQDICIEPITNPLCLYWDCAAQEPLKRDARHWFLTSMISKEVYEATYPDKQVVNFEEIAAADQTVLINDWVQESQVRICEYWYKTPVTKELALLADGSTVDLADGPPEQPILKQRTVKTHKIMMCILGGGDAILADPVEWVGDEFPFIVVFGEEITLDGKNHWFGLTRFAKDAQRSYNVSRTNMVESISLTPQAKWWMTPAQASGLESALAEGHEKNYPYMLYNPDSKAPGPPQRMASADIPQSMIAEIQMASDDIKNVTGIFDNSLGKQANEVSGTAIKARQTQGEIATFNYMDNLAKGIRRTWEILVNIIPKVYDTTRSVRILGSDGADDYVKINHVDPATGKAENDLTRGKYDVTITVGPAFSTQRQEASEIYGQMAANNPELYQVAGDLIFKAMDLPYSQDISDRIKLMLPPPIQQSLQAGKDIPPEVQQMMSQAQAAMQQVQQHGQLVQQAADEAKKEQLQAGKDKNDAQAAQAQIKVDIANLKVAEANLATDVANFKALVAQTEAKMGDTQDAAVVAADREFLSNQITASLTDIQQKSQEFAQQAIGMISDFHAKAQPTIVVPPKPRITKMITKRENGVTTHTPIYEDQGA